MMPALARLLSRPRERRLAIVAGVLSGCWAVLALAVQPLWDLGQDVAGRVQAQRQKLEAVSRLLAQQPAADARAQLLAAFLSQDAAEGGAASFLNELESLSRSAGVTLNLKPRPAVRDGRMSRMEIELDLEGSQQGLLGFVDALLRAPHLLTVERLRMSTIPAKPELLRANVVIHQLSWLR